MSRSRLPCPVCIGVKMGKRSPAGVSGLELDLCPRCGGVWFELGEIQASRSVGALPDPGPVAGGVRTRCSSCSAFVSRAEPNCPVCGQGLLIDCPKCDQPMSAAAHGPVTLDVCKTCRGVWFDRGELAYIWSGALALVALRNGASQTGDGGGSLAAVDLGGSLLEALAYAPT